MHISNNSCFPVTIAALSDEEFISYIKDSLYGEYTKDDLEEFKSVLIKKELYHRIGLVNQLIQEMK